MSFIVPMLPTILQGVQFGLSLWKPDKFGPARLPYGLGGPSGGGTPTFTGAQSMLPGGGGGGISSSSGITPESMDYALAGLGIPGGFQ
jgi:hypothetical protein